MADQVVGQHSVRRGGNTITVSATDTSGPSTSPTMTAMASRQCEAPTATGTAGYLLVPSEWEIFNYGDALFYGSEGRQPLNAPIVGLAWRYSSAP